MGKRPLVKRYFVEIVRDGVWTVLKDEHVSRNDAVAVMRKMLADGSAVRGQIHVIELWVD